MNVCLILLLSFLSFPEIQEEKLSEQNEIFEFKMDPDPESAFVDRKKNQLVKERNSKFNEGLDLEDIKSGKMFLAKFRTVELSMEKESEDKRLDVSVNLMAMDHEDFEASGIELTKGSQQEFFNAPFNVIISKEFALKYFGETDPFNKILILENKYHVFVKGVYQSNSFGLKYDLITNTQTFDKLGR